MKKSFTNRQHYVPKRKHGDGSYVPLIFTNPKDKVHGSLFFSITRNNGRDLELEVEYVTVKQN